MADNLTTTERQTGKKYLRRFVALNGITVAFLMDDVLILYGIRNGLADPQLAILASFIHLTMPFMILGKLLIKTHGAAWTWGYGFLFRYISASILILAPFAGRLGHQWLVTAVVLLGGFGFALFRAIGLVGNSPLVGEVTTPRDRGKFIAGNWARTQSTYLFSLLTVIVAMRFIDKLWIYQVIIALGCSVGFYASRQILKVPETDTPLKSASEPLIRSIKSIWTRSRYRRLLFGWTAGIGSFAFTIPFSIITIKNGYGIPDHIALIFTLLVITGGVISSLLSSGIADRVGMRPLLIIYLFGFFIVSGYWALAPARFLPIPTGVIFFFAGFCKIGIIVGLSHYFLSAVDKKDRVDISLFVRMLSGAIVGLGGSVGGGTILKLLELSPVTGLDIYRTYFRIIIIILIPFFFAVLRLEKLREWKVTSVLSLLFSMRDIRALFVLNRMEQSPDFITDVDQLVKLGKIRSRLSESTLRAFLDSPRLAVRVQAIQALREIEFKAKTAALLRKEVLKGEYTSGWIAAQLLGERGITEAIPELREGLASNDQFLKGKCMVALARCGDTESYGSILDIFLKTENPRITIHGAYALVEIGEQKNIEHLLEKTTDPHLPDTAYDEILISIAQLCGNGETCYQFLREYRNDKNEAFSIVQPSIETLFGVEKTGRYFSVETDPGVNQSSIPDTIAGEPVEWMNELCGRYDEFPGTVFREFIQAHGSEGIETKLFCCMAVVLVQCPAISSCCGPHTDSYSD
jgi:hypothetical protein